MNERVYYYEAQPVNKIEAAWEPEITVQVQEITVTRHWCFKKDYERDTSNKERL